VRFRAWTAFLIGACGAFIVIESLNLHSPVTIMLLAAVCGIGGTWVGLSAVKELRPVSGFHWTRAIATAGALVSALVFAAPVVLILTTVAMFPRQMAREPMAVNNIKKLITALQAYGEDFDGRLPGWVRGNDGRTYHNVWDQQLAPYVNGDIAFVNGTEGRGIRSPFQPPPRTRVVCYGLNGLLITRPKASFDGNADWASGPDTRSLDAIASRGNTIVLAELATTESMGGVYSLASPHRVAAIAGDSRAWADGLPEWIDIDPRAWVETSGPVKSYERRYWNPKKGVGRELHAGGACYAFADGHVAFLKIRVTVTGGQTGMSPDELWSSSNTGNMWNPR
jgi:prepilin-type processing-associated H-X9-DG protein